MTSSSSGATQMAAMDNCYREEDPDAWEKMKREIAELKRRKMKAKSKAAKDKEDQVHSELLAMDATRARVKSSDLVTKLKSLYGPQDLLNKPSVSVKKTLK